MVSEGARPWGRGRSEFAELWSSRKNLVHPRVIFKVSFFGGAFHEHWLRGPVAILFISRDTLSDSIAKCFRACFPGDIAQVSRDMLQSGVSH